MTKAERKPVPEQATRTVASYEDYADIALVPVEGDSLSVLHAMAADFLNAQKAVTDAEEALAKAKDAFEVIERKRIPDWLEEHGMEKFESKDPSTGVKTLVKYSDMKVASIPVESRPAAFSWFEGIGKGEIISTTLKVDVGKEPREYMAVLLAVVAAAAPGKEAAITQSINPQTLSATVRGILAEGVHTVPEELIKVERLRKATVKIG